ncbi:ribosomal RNA processing protein 1 homolog A-like [Pristis pectinata]|uniref:ribosomal RNA processing protein 1 homolog A-like n=1 Tax=Pristis pectinata TaxID=685728 RepID=UPI00223CC63F|nr:ribosomal RNA processing protein 1 homolog A-like [Pristis pectinata]
MAAAAEIQFAQRLASNEKRFRDRAVRRLRRYFSARSQRLSGGFSQEELLKIWKGIFYCMWMQDKPLLQEELADSISHLVHTFRNLDAKFLFLETFFQTMNREWNGIDRLRLDKFYTLIRLVLRQFLEELKSTGWDKSVVSRFLRCVMDEVLNPARNDAPCGIRYHFIDIYLQELAKVGTQQLTAEQNLKFIDPFCQIAAKTKDRILFHMISQGIFELIVDQAPFAIEDLMNELQANEEDDASGEELKSSQENGDPAKPKINGSVSGEGAELNGDGENPKHSQHNDDVGPVLQFDYEAVADRLFQLSSRGSTPAHNRKLLYKLVRKFRDLAEGIFPQDVIPHDMSSDEEDEDDFSWKKKKKKQRREKALLGEEEGESKEKAGKGKIKKKRCSKGRLPSGTNESAEPTGEIVTEVSDPTDQELPRKKKKKSRQVDATVIPESTLLSSDMPRIESRGQENLVGEDQVSESKSDAQPLTSVVDSVTPVPKLKRKKQVQAQLCNGKSLPEDSTQEPVVSKKVKGVLVKLRKQTKKQAVGDEVPASQAPVRSKRKVRELSEGPSKKQKLKNSATSQGDARPCAPVKALNTAETSEFVKFEKIPIPKPIFFKKVRSAETTPRRCNEIKTMSTSSGKKVRFGLRKNTTAEFKRTDKSILVSPAGTSRVAFDPKQQPHHSVLKSNSTPTCSPVLRPKRASFSVKKRPTAMDFF